ncbi:MAG TPA: methyltransferase domain-containing protein [Candidatus Binatia bacterium]|nr:methyltransferase domain-containing protein [Candidatus Binatia bacterium]
MSGSGHWERPGLADAIVAGLRETGKDLKALGMDDLAVLDQFHGGGIGASRGLARLLDPPAGARVLDVGGGLGGPARLLAAEHGCRVTVLDLTEDFLRAGQVITALIGLEDRVRFCRGNALDLPFAPASFDVVWTQNSGMNIPDKRRLYAEMRRVLRPRGRLATQEPVVGPVAPPHYPLMWADDASGSFLLRAGELRALLCANGFAEQVWEELAAQPARSAPPDGDVLTIQQLVRGDRLAAIQAATSRNWEEGRLATIQAVLVRDTGP